MQVFLTCNKHLHGKDSVPKKRIARFAFFFHYLQKGILRAGKINITLCQKLLSCRELAANFCFFIYMLALFCVLKWFKCVIQDMWVLLSEYFIFRRLKILICKICRGLNFLRYILLKVLVEKRSYIFFNYSR